MKIRQFCALGCLIFVICKPNLYASQGVIALPSSGIFMNAVVRQLAQNDFYASSQERYIFMPHDPVTAEVHLRGSAVSYLSPLNKGLQFNPGNNMDGQLAWKGELSVEGVRNFAAQVGVRYHFLRQRNLKLSKEHAIIAGSNIGLFSLAFLSPETFATLSYLAVNFAYVRGLFLWRERVRFLKKAEGLKKSQVGREFTRVEAAGVFNRDELFGFPMRDDSPLARAIAEYKASHTDIAPNIEMRTVFGLRSTGRLNSHAVDHWIPEMYFTLRSIEESKNTPLLLYPDTLDKFSK